MRPIHIYVRPLMGVLAAYRRMLHLAPVLGPPWLRRMLVNLMPWKSLHDIVRLYTSQRFFILMAYLILA
jgi:hypothetical protein